MKRQRDKLTDREQLEEACWNGLLEIFPEIFRESANLKSLYLWQIKQAQSFLEIEMGDTPGSKIIISLLILTAFSNNST
jgi:hypothetical protein